jgi:hypothetical protein
MGPAVSRLTDALSWSGRDVTLILFAVFPGHAELDIARPMNAPEPEAIRTYHLEDLDACLGGRECHEYDLVYERVPSRLDSVVVSWIEAALAAGADFAWFGYEGSFDFDHILTEDIANQIFAVGSSQGIDLALDDDYRDSPGWVARLVGRRDELGL